MSKLFKKKAKKPKKKLTPNQLVTRISAIIFVVAIVVMLILVVPQSINNVKDSTLGQVEILNDLNITCKLSDVTDNTISDNDKLSLQNTLTNANVDIYDGSHFSNTKLNSLSSCSDFSLTPTQLACFTNEMLGISTNYYGTTFYNIELSDSTLLCVAELNFRTLCRLSSEQIEMYSSLNYTVPNRVYITTSTTLSKNVSSSIVFNALNEKKSERAKSFVNSNRSNFDVENVLYNIVISALDSFCDKANMTYTFTNNNVVFTQKTTI